MWRGIVAAAVFVVVADCKSSLRRCDEGCINGAVCDPVSQLCIFTADPRPEFFAIHVPPRAGPGPVTFSAEYLPPLPSDIQAPAELYYALDRGALVSDAGVGIYSMRRVDAGYYEVTGRFQDVEGLRTVTIAVEGRPLMETRTIYLDLSAPAPVIEIVPPPTRASSTDGGLHQVDDEALAAFRRDETAVVRIDAPDPDMTVARIELAIDAGAQSRTPNGSCMSRFDGGSCVQASVDLWRHPMNSFRESVGITVEVGDSLGNAALRDGGSLTVTRFKWSRTLPNPYGGGIALTRDGTVTLHSPLPVPRLLAWRPDGTDLWSVDSTGDAYGLVSVGTAPNEHVYEVTFDDTTGLGRSSATPVQQPDASISPLYPSEMTGNFTGGVIFNQLGDEVAWFGHLESSRDWTISTWRLSDRASGTLLDAGTVNASGPGVLVSDNARVFLLSLNPSPLNSEVDVFGPAFDGYTPQRFPRLFLDGGVTSAAVSQPDSLYFGVSTPDGGVVATSSRTAVSAQRIPVPIRRPAVVIGANTVFVSEIAVLNPGQMSLCAIPLGSTTPNCAALRTRSHPIMGAPPTSGGAPILYLTGQDSAIDFSIRAVDAQTLSPIWEAPLAQLHRPATIDCSRTATGAPRLGVPGVLYMDALTTTTTIISAIIVDSPGIDGTARWPMQTHDPRNTGNSQMPLTPFYCP